jgi:AcrR family transcriptional regulator
MSGGRVDPRPARSRARLLDAATALLRSGGPAAVTVDAVLRGANVARATLYRHFPSGNDLLAAAFQSVMPPPPMPPSEGPLRERLTRLLQDWTDLIGETPMMLSAMYWVALGSDLEQLPEADSAADSHAVQTLRERIAQQYAAPFDAIFDSPQALAELGELDRVVAISLLLGPLVTVKMSTLPGINYGECIRASVEGFLHVYGKPTGITATNTESEGA